MFEANYPIRNLVPAEYNPREISTESIIELQRSIKEIGVLKPIIATSSGTIIAGHQRTKSMLEIGLDHCPAYIIDNINLADEIRFNQIHNASDIEISDGDVTLNNFKIDLESWCMIDPKTIKVKDKIRGAAHRNEIMRLLTKYGEWGASIVDESGNVIVSKNYAICCKILNKPLLCKFIPNEKVNQVKYYFSKEYGKFSYKKVPKTTYAQTMAQMMRLREEAEVSNSSTLYENFVIPQINKQMRILDFGAGQKDYVNKLRTKGFNIIGIEFFYRVKGQLAIDIKTVNKDIDTLINSIKSEGLFDVVICDSVLNSVDSIQAQSDVLTCLNAFCKPNGRIFFSGRSLESVLYNQDETMKFTNFKKKPVYFIDDEGFSAMYQRGFWMYQKFHRADEVRQLTETFISSNYQILNNDSKPILNRITTAGWFISAIKNKTLSSEQIQNSLLREFNLPLPGGTSVNRHLDIVEAYKYII